MGFSVSGAAAIVLVAGFVAFGMFHTAAADSYERIADAESDQTDDALAQQNTAIEVVSATYDDAGDELTVTVDNDGTEQLRLSATDVVVDGAYETNWLANSSVAGNDETDLWLSGERATISVWATTQPDRVKVIAESGVSDTAEVT